MQSDPHLVSDDRLKMCTVHQFTYGGDALKSPSNHTV